MIDLDSFSDSSRNVAMATDFGRNLQITFINWQDGIPKRIGIWQFRYLKMYSMATL